jgi:hypothetical protein
MLSLYIIRDIFGKDNSLLCANIIDDWVSNANWKDLSISYQLDRYVGIIPEMKTAETKKFWADIWEAWWSGIYIERELWNESVGDIKSYFRRLISLKYHMTIDLYSTVYNVDRTVQSHTFRKITRDQILAIKVGTDTYIETSKPIKATKSHYGYITSISQSTSSSDLNQNLSLYDVTEDDAISKTLAYANSGYKGLSHQPSSTD